MGSGLSAYTSIYRMQTLGMMVLRVYTNLFKIEFLTLSSNSFEYIKRNILKSYSFGAVLSLVSVSKSNFAIFCINVESFRSRIKSAGVA